MASIADTTAIARPRRRRLELGIVLALAWLVLLVVLAALGPIIGIQNPDDGDLLDILSLPTAAHWLGTDSLGRDTFARAVYGAQVSLTVALGSVGIGLALGGTLGLIGGYFGRWPDRLIMGAMTVLLCFPGIILAIALVSSLGPSVGNVTFAIGVIFVPAFARIARANTLSLRSREFVLAAQSLGAKLPRILIREILPNLMPALLSYAVVMLGVAILAEAALGFLGLSVRPPQPSWGGMIAAERGNLAEAPHAVFIPAAVMFLTVLAINWLGEATRRLFDIRAQSL
ncbi:ABC transporter permease [Bradyrhizobium sp. LHD-71]|uniref:ABC transporter permease n=1 Tax=Bradyrhizobium sp. LHD-71 TaxID=3072141 RepID=UPI00280D9072|nr:ABC transporter permease [Bradyrhizobium sp. LHD-71]MDQ8731008.1 ABC transporter permease [Bradyrhizobium sp. LHD-71]